RDSLAEAQRLKALKEKGTLAVEQDVQTTAARMTEQRITDRFIQISERRKPKLTEGEKCLLKALNGTLSVNFDKKPLKEVIDFLHDKGDLNIFVDEDSLKEVNVEYDDPVTFKVRGASVRFILKKVLADRGLTFFIKDAAVHVMTPDKAKQFMVE